MGVLTTSGSLSRVLGPIGISNVYQSEGLYYTTGGIAVVLLIALIFTLIAYKRLVPEPSKTSLDKYDKEDLP